MKFNAVKFPSSAGGLSARDAFVPKRFYACLFALILLFRFATLAYTAEPPENILKNVDFDLNLEQWHHCGQCSKGESVSNLKRRKRSQQVATSRGIGFASGGKDRNKLQRPEESGSRKNEPFLTRSD